MVSSTWLTVQRLSVYNNLKKGKSSIGEAAAKAFLFWKMAETINQS